MVEWISECPVFSLVPAGTDPEQQPALRDLLECRRHFRNHGWMSERLTEHQAANANVFRLGGQRGHDGPALIHRLERIWLPLDEKVVGMPYRIEAGLIRLLRKALEIGVWRGTISAKYWKCESEPNLRHPQLLDARFA